MQSAEVANPFPSARRKSPEHVLATIKVFNQVGHDSIDKLGENYPELSEHHRKFFKVKVKDSNDSFHYTSDDSASVTGLPSPTPFNHWDGEWKITLDGMALNGSGPSLALRMGKGSSREGVDRGVDLLTTCPGSSTHGIIKVHAILCFHQESGYLMLEGVSDDYPVRYMLDNDILPLGARMSHVMWQTINIFYLGATMYVLTYEKLSTQQLETLRQARDLVFSKARLSAPDHRLPLFPNQPVLRRLGSTIVYKYVDSGGFGMVGVGVDISSGNPCAVKTVHILGENVLHEILNELEVLLKFRAKAGLIQAWYICCDHGYRFDAGQQNQVRAAFTSCGIPDNIHIVMTLAIGSFKSINWNNYTIQQIVDFLYGVVLGIKGLHVAGYMHRDVTERNMLLKPGRTPVGVLSDFGKASHTEFAKDIHIGPAYSRAPEANGVDYYTNAIDVWSAGQAFANIIMRKGYDMPDVHAYIGEVRQLTVPELKDHLDQLASLSSDDLYSPLVSIVKDMLADKSKRPSIKVVAMRWSIHVSPQALLVYDNIIASPRPAMKIHSMKGSAGRPPMAPARVKHRVGQPTFGTDVAGLSRDGGAFEDAQRGREIGKIMRSGGGPSTPINRPSQVPFLETLRYPLEPRPPHRFDKPADIARRYIGHKLPKAWPLLDLDSDKDPRGAQYIGHAVPTVRPLPEADEDVPRAPGTGAKRTWEDRDSEDAGPGGKAAKLD